MDLNKIKPTPLVPRYPQKEITLDHFRRMLEIRFNKLQTQLDEMQILINEFLDQ